MDLPVMTGGKRIGELQLTQNKNGWLARVKMPDAGRVVRLLIFGENESVYLGIPEPDGRGAMVLERQLRRLPQKPCYCAEQAQKQETETPKKSPLAHVVWMGGRAYYF